MQDGGGTDSGRVWDKGAERDRKAAYRAKKAAYDAGYAGEPGDVYRDDLDLTVEWVKGVWKRQQERATAGAVGKQEARPRPESKKKERR